MPFPLVYFVGVAVGSGLGCYLFGSGGDDGGEKFDTSPLKPLAESIKKELPSKAVAQLATATEEYVKEMTALAQAQPLHLHASAATLSRDVQTTHEAGTALQEIIVTIHKISEAIDHSTGPLIKELMAQLSGFSDVHSQLLSTKKTLESTIMHLQETIEAHRLVQQKLETTVQRDQETIQKLSATIERMTLQISAGKKGTIDEENKALRRENEALKQLMAELQSQQEESIANLQKASQKIESLRSLNKQLREAMTASPSTPPEAELPKEQKSPPYQIGMFR